MTEIRAAQLALTVDEAAQLLSTRFGVELDADSLEELHRRTEGWPAGLQLAGISLQTEPSPRAFVERFTGEDRNVADYLTSEVIDRLSDSRREFLTRTSVLDRLSGALCDQVVGVSHSQEILEDLERSNLFVIPLDNRREWYRYHHLMQEWLLHELRREDVDAIADLRVRASRWHADRGSLEAAIKYAGLAGDYGPVGDLLDRYVTDWPSVNWPQLGRWFELLPDDVMARHPIALTARVWLGMTMGNTADASRWIETAEAGIDAMPPDLRPTAETMAELFRTAFDFVDGEMDRSRVRSKALADEIGGPDSTMVRPLRPAMHAGALGMHALSTFWTNGAREAIPLLRQAVATRAEASIPDHGFTAVLALAYSEVGDWTAAEDAATVAFGLPRQFEQYRWPDLMAAHYALGRALVAADDRQRGIDEARKGVQLAREFGWPIFIAYGCLVLADATDDYVEKRVLVREARELIDACEDPGRVPGLVAAMERELSIRRPANSSHGAVYVEPLTDRELETLRLLRGDLSLREIANQLYISHNTIKGYTKSIYRKLGVSSREMAIETARELDLI
jgi:LuxR family maltose regulon positive regulatory protein